MVGTLILLWCHLDATIELLDHLAYFNISHDYRKFYFYWCPTLFVYLLVHTIIHPCSNHNEALVCNPMVLHGSQPNDLIFSRFWVEVMGSRDRAQFRPLDVAQGIRCEQAAVIH